MLFAVSGRELFLGVPCGVVRGVLGVRLARFEWARVRVLQSVGNVCILDFRFRAYSSGG